MKTDEYVFKIDDARHILESIRSAFAKEPLYTETEIRDAIRKSWERQQFNARMFWSALERR